MTTRDDLDKITRHWAAMLTDATAIHERDGHCGELFDSCPFFPCNIVRDTANELLSEYVKVNNRVPPLTGADIRAVAERL